MRLLAVLAVVAVLVSGACTKRDLDKEKVVGFIDSTSPLSHRFVYRVESRGAGQLVVQGVVEDDFRYKLQLSLDGTPSVEQVASDDAVAVRFLDPGLVDGFTDRAVADKVDVETSIEGATVFDALRARRWVLDDAGAPSPVVQVRDERSGEAAATTAGNQARDPLFEGRTALAYVRRTAQGSIFVKYDPETLNPTYRVSEDPFPKPKEGSGVDRYDTYVPDLPTAAQATSGSSPSFPTAANFRKMAVYVKRGRVIAVREFIGVSTRQLADLVEYMQALIDATAPDDVKAGFRARVRSLSSKPEELTDFLLGGLNSFVASAGRELLQFRTMSLELQDFGAVDEKVELPGDAITGDLAVLRNLGRKPLTGAEDQGARPAVPQPPDSTTESEAQPPATDG
jgi:hypothetical protein